MSFHQNVQEYVKKAGKCIGASDEFMKILLEPEKVLEYKLEAKVNGQKIEADTHIVIDSTIMGSAKGGMEIRPESCSDSVKGKASAMTPKCALGGNPHGGAKSGVRMNPNNYTPEAVEGILRNFIQQSHDVRGPYGYCAAPDVSSTPKHMAVMVHEMMKIKEEVQPGSGELYKGSLTGKPLSFGGSQVRDEATGFGGMLTTQHYMKHYGDKKGLRRLNESTYILDGFGNAGRHFALHARKQGMTLVGVSDSRGAIYNKKGIDLDKIIAIKDRKGGVTDYSDGEIFSNSDESRNAFLSQESDVLTLAAMYDVINQTNMETIKSNLVVELSNGGISHAAAEHLAYKQKDILIDIFANAGGVNMSCAEVTQNIQRTSWTREDATIWFTKRMEESFQKVFEIKKEFEVQKELDCPWHTAAYIGGIRPIQEAAIQRGII